MTVTILSLECTAMDVTAQIRVKAIGAAPSPEEAEFLAEVGRIEEQINGLPKEDTLGRAELFWSLGRRFENNDKKEEALSAYENASVLLREAGEVIALGQILHSSGSLHWQLNQNRKAELCWAAAEKVFQQQGEHELLGILWLDRGVAQRDSGQRSIAHSAFSSALRAFTEGEMGLGQAHSHFLLGEIDVATNPDRARWNLDRAQMLYTQLQESEQTGSGIRLTEPSVPNSVGDPRDFDVAELRVFCEMRCGEIEAAVGPTAAEAIEGSEAASGFKRGLLAFGVLVLTSAAFTGFPYVWQGLGLTVIEPQIFRIAVAGMALICSFVGLLFVGTESRLIQMLSPVLVACVVFETTELIPLAPPRPRIAAAPIAVTASDAPALQVAAHEDPDALVSSAVATTDAEPEQSRDWFDEAAEAYAEAGEQVKRADALIKAVKLDVKLADGDSQRKHLVNLVEAQRLSFNSEGELKALQELVGVERLQGRNGSLIETLGRLVEVAQAEKLPEDEAAGLLEVARTARRLGDRTKALKALEDADAIFDGANDLSGRGDVEMERAKIHVSRQVAKAEQSYEKALAFYREAKNGDSASLALLELGAIADKRGRRLLSKRHYEDAVKECGAGNQACASRALVALSKVSPGAARQTLERAAAAAADDESGVRVAALVNLAGVEGQQGDAAAAKKVHADAFLACDDIKDPIERAKALVSVGGKAEELGVTDRARDAYNEALMTYDRVRNRTGQLSVLERLRRLAKSGDPLLAQRYTKRMEQIQTEIKSEG